MRIEKFAPIYDGNGVKAILYNKSSPVCRGVAMKSFSIRSLPPLVGEVAAKPTKGEIIPKDLAVFKGLRLFLLNQP